MGVARAWLVTAAVLVVHLFGLGHFVLFTHSRCEHGELVDGPPRHGASSAESADAVAAGRPRGPGAVQGHADGNHEHCAGVGLAAAIPAVAPACPELTLLAALVVADPGRPPSGVPPVRLLDLAPKSSPPV